MPRCIIPPSVSNPGRVVLVGDKVVYACGPCVVAICGSQLGGVLRRHSDIQCIAGVGHDCVLVHCDRFELLSVSEGGTVEAGGRYAGEKVLWVSCLQSLFCLKVSGCHIETLAEIRGHFAPLASVGDYAMVVQRQDILLASLEHDSIQLEHLFSDFAVESASMCKQSEEALLAVVSEACGLHSIWTLTRSPGLIWSLSLGDGSVVCPLDKSVLGCIEADRRQILESFHLNLVCYTPDGELVFYGIQQSVVHGATVCRGESIFSCRLPEHCQPASKMGLFERDGTLLVHIVGTDPPFTMTVAPFAAPKPVASFDTGIRVRRVAEMAFPSIAHYHGKYLCSIDERGDCQGALHPELPNKLVSRWESDDHMAIQDSILIIAHSDSLAIASDGITRASGRLRRDADHRVCVISDHPDSKDGTWLCKLQGITDVQFIDGEHAAVTNVVDGRAVYQIRRARDAAVVGEGVGVDEAMLCMVDPFSAVYKRAEQVVEVAPFRDPHNLYASCRVEGCLSCKVFLLPHGNAKMIGIMRQSSVELLVKMHAAGRMRWHRLVELKDDLGGLSVCDFSVDQSTIYFQSTEGVFSVPLNLRDAMSCAIAFDRTVHDSSIVAVQDYGLLAPDSAYRAALDTVAHLRDGIDSGFGMCLMLELLKSRRAAVPRGLVQLSWLLSFMSECQEQLMLKFNDYCEECDDWPSIAATGFPLWLNSVDKLHRCVEFVCRHLAKRDLLANIDVVSILFALMGKEKALLALWRASHHPDSAKLVAFLQQPTSAERCAVAEKTAFALLAKQREHLAVFFFLVAQQPGDAVNVARTRICDVPLATVIARYCNLAHDIHPDEQTPIEAFLLSSLNGDTAWDKLLAKASLQYGWWPPTAALKKAIHDRHAVGVELDDISELWSHRLFRSSLPFIAQLQDEGLRMQLEYEAKCQSVVLDYVL